MRVSAAYIALTDADTGETFLYTLNPGRLRITERQSIRRSDGAMSPTRLIVEGEVVSVNAQLRMDASEKGTP